MIRSPSPVCYAQWESQKYNALHPFCTMGVAEHNALDPFCIMGIAEAQCALFFLFSSIKDLMIYIFNMSGMRDEQTKPPSCNIKTFKQWTLSASYIPHIAPSLKSGDGLTTSRIDTTTPSHRNCVLVRVAQLCQASDPTCESTQSS